MTSSPSSPSSSSSSSSSSSQRRYALKKPLARGGMAEVFLATDEEAGVDVVVKRLLPALSDEPSFRQLFLDEARLCLKLKHDNVVRVLDVGFEHGEHFMAMEYVDGIDAYALVEKLGGPVPVDVAVRIALSVAAALVYAHELVGPSGPLGVVHRDVNPQNVLVAKSGVVKLADFGIARCAEHVHRTQTGAVVGKPGFMAPEQVAGDVADVRTDVYGAAGVLAYLLLGEAATHNGKNVVDLKKSGAPPAVVDVMVRALSLNPSARQRSARAFAAELAAAFDAPADAAAVADVVAQAKGERTVVADRPRGTVSEDVEDDVDDDDDDEPQPSAAELRETRTVALPSTMLAPFMSKPQPPPPPPTTTTTTTTSPALSGGFALLAAAAAFVIVLLVRLLLARMS